MLKFKKQEKKEEVDKATEQRASAATTEKSSSDNKNKEERRSRYRDRSRSPRRNRSRSPNSRSSRYSSSRHEDRISSRRSRSVSPRRRRRSTSRSPSPIKKKKSTTEKKKTPKQSFAYKLIEIEINDRLGKKARVKCSPSDTIGDFKKLAAAQIGTDPKKIILKKWYKEFRDHITLEDYELHDGMNIELYYR